MVAREHPIYRALFVFVLAPIAAAVVISALLLFGVEARVVFFVGLRIKTWLSAAGVHAPNAVGVLATVFVFWIPIVVAGLLWERSRRPKN